MAFDDEGVRRQRMPTTRMQVTAQVCGDEKACSMIGNRGS